MTRNVSPGATESGIPSTVRVTAKPVTCTSFDTVLLSVGVNAPNALAAKRTAAKIVARGPSLIPLPIVCTSPAPPERVDGRRPEGRHKAGPCMHRARSGGSSCRHLQYPPTPSQSHLEAPPLTDVVIAAAGRTAVGKYGRAFRNVEAVKLGSTVISEAVNRAGLVPADIEEVLMGNVISAGLGQNPARQAALFGGLPERVGATTNNKVCGSGLQAVMFASDMIRSGSAEVL